MTLLSRSETCPDHRAGLRYYRGRHFYWTAKRGVRSLYSSPRPARSCPDARYLAVTWRLRARVARIHTERWLREKAQEKRNERAAAFRALYEKWRCIHEHEGAWN